MTESIKEQDGAEQTGGSSVPKHAGVGPVGGIGGAVAIPIVVVLLVGSFFFLPLSPTISGSLTITTAPFGFQSQVKLAVGPVSYSRDTIFRSLSAGAGSIELQVTPSATGTYTMTIQVSYGTASPLTQTFDKVGDGMYGFRIRYVLQQETASIPYSVTISISGQTIETVTTTFMIYPS